MSESVQPPSPSAHPRSWTPPTPEELAALLPQYEISGLLGAGGMGAVYRGRQARLGREVAIKVLPETFSQDEVENELNFAGASSRRLAPWPPWITQPSSRSHAIPASFCRATAPVA